MKIVVAPDSFKGSLSSAEITRICTDVIRGHLPEASVVSLPIADGIGGVLKVFCGAKLVSGIDAVLEFTDFHNVIEDADFVVTGEGRIDFQSVRGKAVCGIAKACKAKGIPVYVVCGGIGEGVREVYDMGVKSIMPITSRPMDMDEAIENARELLEDAVDRMMRFVL